VLTKIANIICISVSLIHTCRQTDRQTYRETERHTDRQTEWHLDEQTEAKSDRHHITASYRTKP